MSPFISIQIRSLIEHIRLLEAFVTTPIGLHADIKMLREAMPFADADDLPRDQLRKRRNDYSRLSEDSRDLALKVVASMNASLNVIESVHQDGDAILLQPSWIRRARMVLNRTQQQVSGEIRADVATRIKGLYVIVDPGSTRGRDVLKVATEALRGGANVIQLRDKTRDKGEVLGTARGIKAVCEAYKALFIVNDDADLAASCGAHGLHVGQSDLPVQKVRSVLATSQIVGRSNNGLTEALESHQQGADYIAVGAVYRTATMGKIGRTPLGIETISKVKSMVSQPIVAIGGISAENIGQVARAGADCICVVSAVTHADDPAAAAYDLVNRINAAR